MGLLLQVALSGASRWSRWWGRLSFSQRMGAVFILELALYYPAMKLLFGQ